MKKMLISIFWLPWLLIYFITSSLFYVKFISSANPTNTINSVTAFKNNFTFYAVLPAIFGIKNSAFFIGDARPLILKKFIKKYNPQSDLLPYTNYLVDAADRYNLHFALTTAIAMQESNLCKYIPYDSRNCWGLGIYGDKIWRFNSYEEAIEAVSKTLSRYQTHGRVTPDDIMQIYTPRSNGSWAYAVNKFIKEIENY